MIQSVTPILPGTNLVIVKNDSRQSSDLPSPGLSSSRSGSRDLSRNDRTIATDEFSPSSFEESEPISRLLDEVRQSLKEKEVDSRVEVSLDKELNQVIIRVVDKETGDLQRQFPPEEILELKRYLNEHPGLFVEEEA